MKKVREQKVQVGDKINNLIVIECNREKDKSNHYISKVRCKCGKEFYVRDTLLINKKIKSCNSCSNIKYKHGMTNTRIFNIWQGMKQRCKDNHIKNFKVYKARGITVCKEWEDDFINFYNWAIHNGYKDNLSIDRIDNDKGYNSLNCRCVDTYMQANNKRNNRIIYYKNKKYTLASLARKFKIDISVLQYRLNKNWDIEKALCLKPKIGRNQYE